MGTFHVVERSPMWLRSEVAGLFDDAVCVQVITVVDRWRGDRVGLTVFCDVSAVNDYDVPARERISGWLRGLGNAFTRVHVLVDGRMVAWALKIVAVTSGANIVPYHSKAEFESAFTRHVGDGRSRTG